MKREKNRSEKHVNREWKASAFTAYFGTPERAAEIYRALEQTDDAGPEDIEFTTLQGVMFMARKNDLAFTVRKKVLVIGEHQSTVNLNMPLRDAIYYGRTMEKLIPSREIYKTGRVQVPTPEFYVFYNGTAPQPSEQILKLPDSYLENTDSPMLELQVKVININLSANHPILEKSRAMYEYSWFVERIRECQRTEESVGIAVQKAMRACLKEGVMVDFIREHGSEVENMLFTEFNMDDALEVRFEEGMEQGQQIGRVEKLVELVVRKLKKGKNPREIAEELEEGEETVQRICRAVEACGEEADSAQIYRWMEKKA